MRTEILEDGTIHRKQSPRRGIPFFSDWLKVLLARGAAFIVKELDTRRGSETFGQMIDKIKPTDRLQEQAATVDEAGVVRIICIGCATPTPKMDMSKVRIGGLIQLPVDEPISHSEIERRWKVQPVFKTGLGCPTCAEKYLQAVAETARENDARAEYQDILNEMEEWKTRKTAQAPVPEQVDEKCIHGMRVAFCAVCQKNIRYRVRQPIPEIKKPVNSRKAGTGMLTAFIDVFGGPQE